MSRHNRSRRRQSYNIPGHAHELTFSCYRRYAFRKAERTSAWLAEAIGEARQSQGFWLWAFVFMPDHVHLILYPFHEEYGGGKGDKSNYLTGRAEKVSATNSVQVAG